MFKNGMKIDSKISSILVSVFYDKEKLPDSFIGLYDHICNIISGDFEKNEIDDDALFNMITHLLSYEPGYFRYDNDLDRVDPVRHPQYHLDVNYEDAATYKLGLKEAVDLDWIIKLSDNTKDRCFLISS